MLELDANVRALRLAVAAARRSALSPPPDVRVDQWADTKRVLGPDESRIAGPFRTENMEVARGPMMAVTEPGVHEISICSSAQLLKTTALQNTLGWLIECSPCPILLYQPTDVDVDDFSKDKVNPMLRNSPGLTKAFGGRRALLSKSADNMQSKKRFSGGWYTILSAGTANSFSSRSVRAVLFDEVDKYAYLKAGDQIALGKKRTESYEDSYLIMQVSTPRETGSSRIMKAYLEGDQRQPYITCPDCDHEFVAMWDHVKYEKNEIGVGIPETAAICCPACDHHLTEAERMAIMSTKGAISWRQTKKFTCCGKTQDPDETREWTELHGVGRAVCVECDTLAVSNHHASFKAWAGYTTFRPLSSIVRDWIAAQGDRSKLRAFVNEVLAETFASDEEHGAFEVSPEGLAGRAETPWSAVPAGVQVITAGVDVQDDRLEVELVGWGSKLESWSLDFHVIEGDPALDTTWQMLDDVLLSRHQTADGRSLPVAAACVDSGGHHTSTVYAFAGRRTRRRVWAIKGINESAGSRAPIWPKVNVKTKGHGAKLYNIGTQNAKDQIAKMISAEQEGPYFMHVPTDRAANWFTQLTAEKRIEFVQNGRKVSAWRVKKGVRNEALDCRVYALAAYEGLIATGGFRRGVIDAPGSAVDETGRPLPPVPVASASNDGAPPPPPPPAPKKKRPPPRRSPGGFGGGRGFGGGFGRGGFER